MSEPYSGLRLQATFERHGNVILVHLAGDMDIYSIRAIRPKLAKITQTGVKQFVFTIGDVRQIDSSGLGFLLSFHRELENRNGHLVCVVPEMGTVAKTLKQSRADTVLCCVKNLDLALKLFQAEPDETEQEP